MQGELLRKIAREIRPAELFRSPVAVWITELYLGLLVGTAEIANELNY